MKRLAAVWKIVVSVVGLALIVVAVIALIGVYSGLVNVLQGQAELTNRIEGLEDKSAVRFDDSTLQKRCDALEACISQLEEQLIELAISEEEPSLRGGDDSTQPIADDTLLMALQPRYKVTPLQLGGDDDDVFVHGVVEILVPINSEYQVTASTRLRTSDDLNVAARELALQASQLIIDHYAYSFRPSIDGVPVMLEMNLDGCFQISDIEVQEKGEFVWRNNLVEAYPPNDIQLVDSTPSSDTNSTPPG